MHMDKLTVASRVVHTPVMLNYIWGHGRRSVRTPPCRAPLQGLPRRDHSVAARRWAPPTRLTPLRCMQRKSPTEGRWKLSVTGMLAFECISKLHSLPKYANYYALFYVLRPVAIVTSRAHGHHFSKLHKSSGSRGHRGSRGCGAIHPSKPRLYKRAIRNAFACHRSPLGTTPLAFSILAGKSLIC